MLENYFLRKKTFVICGAYASENLQRVFEENYPVWDESMINPENDFYHSIDKNPVPNFERERGFVLGLIDSYVQQIPFNKMIQFLTIDKLKNSEVKLEMSVSIRLIRSGDFEVYIGDQLVGSVEDNIEIDYIVEKSWDQELRKIYDIDELIKLGEQNKKINN